MTFQEFCKSKLIDPSLFEKGDKEKYDEWHAHYQVMSDASFITSKKFLINNIRRTYPYKPVGDSAQELEKKPAKPAVKIGGKKLGGIKIPPKK